MFVLTDENLLRLHGEFTTGKTFKAVQYARLIFVRELLLRLHPLPRECDAVT